jgi:hypothetical protein
MLHGKSQLYNDSYQKKNWISPSFALYKRTIAEVVDVAMILFHVDERVVQSWESLTSIAQKYDESSNHASCSIKSPKEWRSYVRKKNRLTS